MIGHGLAATWTARALERAGYDVSLDGAGAATRIEVRETPARRAWLLVHGDAVETMTTLEMVIARVRQMRIQ